MLSPLGLDEHFSRIRAGRELKCDDLEYVCNAEPGPYGPSKWYFNNEDGFYYRFKPNGEWFRRVSMKNFENPDDLWSMRIKCYPQADPNDLKPQVSTYTIWQHKQDYHASQQKPD